MGHWQGKLVGKKTPVHKLIASNSTAVCLKGAPAASYDEPVPHSTDLALEIRNDIQIAEKTQATREECKQLIEKAHAALCRGIPYSKQIVGEWHSKIPGRASKLNKCAVESLRRPVCWLRTVSVLPRTVYKHTPQLQHIEEVSPRSASSSHDSNKSSCLKKEKKNASSTVPS